MRFWARSDQNSGFHGYRKLPYGLEWREQCLHFFSAVFHPILFILAGNDDMHKSSDKFEFWPDWTMDCGVSCP